MQLEPKRGAKTSPVALPRPSSSSKQRPIFRHFCSVNAVGVLVEIIKDLLACVFSNAFGRNRSPIRFKLLQLCKPAMCKSIKHGRTSFRRCMRLTLQLSRLRGRFLLDVNFIFLNFKRFEDYLGWTSLMLYVFCS